MTINVKPNAPAAALGRNYPLNCWWVAARAAEVTRTPLGRWLLDIPVILYRTEAGEPVALENRCLHRWAPLSEGFLEGDAVVCPYHGARFAPDGVCRRYPTQDMLPDSARIRAFPVVERGSFVWIWLGEEAARADADPPPDFPFVRDPAWTVLEGGYDLAANYMLFHENLLDLTHFNYLHRDTLGVTNKTPPRYWTEGNVVRSHIVLDYRDKTPEERAAASVFDPAVTHEDNIGAFVSPAYHMATITFFAEEEVRSILQVDHFMTPESAGRTHYWWHFCTTPLIPPEAVGPARARLVSAFDEDAAIMTAIQATVERDPRGRDYIELSFNGDLGGLHARRALGRILAAELKADVPG